MKTPLKALKTFKGFREVITGSKLNRYPISMSLRPVRVCSELSYEILWTLAVPKATMLKEPKLEVKDFVNTWSKPREIYLIK